MLGRRSTEFDVLMQWIHLLRGTWWPGPTFTARDLYPAEGRNVITEGALARDDWDDFLSVDSDHLPSPAFLERIAEYPLDVGIVVGTYFGREYPFDLQAWDSDPESEGLKAIHPSRIIEMLDRPGLYRVGGGGTGWMFIRRNVLELMHEQKGPGNVWEIKGLTPELATKLGIGLVLGEDVMFCVQARQLLDVQVWLDTDPRIESAHLGTMRYTRREWYAAHLANIRAPLDTDALAQSGHRLEATPTNLRRLTQAAGRRVERATRRLSRRG
jgi:hypothetical protein